MLAAISADAVQVGSRFAASMETHENFKKTIIETKEGELQLTLKSWSVLINKKQILSGCSKFI
jgi:NAD(P)H-dependent flavin oxidoreductase YrpB (nitropropane dioxygenase family)